MIQQKEIDNFIQIAQKDLMENRVQSSIRGLYKVLELDPDNLEVHYLLGLALIKEERFQEAETHLLRVTGSEFSYLYSNHAHLLLGYLYARQKQYPRAEKAFRTSLQSNFNNHLACAALGHVCFKQGRMADARAYLEQALEINPEGANARNSYAYILCEDGEDPEMALREANAALKQDPHNPAFLDTLGWIYYKKGKEELARETLKRALELAPDSEEIKEHLRRVLAIE